jgi:hypothetical protein
MIVAGLALSGARVIELLTRGQTDADDPAASLRYLTQYGDAYVITGILLLVLAAALVVSGVAVHRMLSAERPSLWIDAGAIAAYLAAGSLGIAGTVRISAPGPLAYISSMDETWGESAYLAGHVIGTQSLFSGGVLGMSVWLLGMTIAAWRRRSVARGALVVAVFALDLVVGLVGPLIDIPDGVFAFHLFSLLVGLPLAFAVIGVALVATRRRRSPEAASS